MDKAYIQSRIEKNKDLYPFLTLKIHVIAQFFFEAKTSDDLIDIKKYAIKQKIPLFILGGGSNLFFTKNKIKTLVVKNSYIDLKKIKEDENSVLIKVSSGYPVSSLVNLCIEHGWAGLEYHLGLPGTVGGAIFMNSKWMKPPSFFGDNLIEAELIDEKGNLKKVKRDYFQFDYDYSILQKTKELVLTATFKVKKEKRDEIKKRALDALEYRKKTQPLGVATCGCFFQNIKEEERQKKKLPTTSAGYLIDKAGLKNFSVGDFYISPVHANFIINKGGGKIEDLQKLLNIVKEKVKNKFGIILKEEVVKYDDTNKNN
jgi:UDP-N-acetylmuramate dehydrogenase